MKQRKYSHLQLGAVLGIGTLLALVLCFQCVRTYLYTNAVLVPQQAEREAERQAGALAAAARGAGITDPHGLGPVIEQTLESARERVLWMRVLDQDSQVIAQGGTTQGTAKVPPRWWERVEKHENTGMIVETSEGKAYVAMLPFRTPRPQRPPEAGPPDDRSRPRGPNGDAPGGPQEVRGRPPFGRRGGAFVIELAIPLKAVTGAFDGLRQNLIVGLIASIALLVSVAVIGLSAPHYLRGKYLESELQLARRVQDDLQPKQHLTSPHVEFAAAAVAADHVGGDFHDIFETVSGKIAIVLGDVSGKGVPAALLVSVLQGAIRSSTATQHESACERINRMMCERTACERYATLFWGVFDPVSGTLRYVNAGHAAPMLVRHAAERIERLDEGGPVIGILPQARYSAGVTEIAPSDTLVLYSDGINEASNHDDEEFGEDRIQQVVLSAVAVDPSGLCDQIMTQVTRFSREGAPPDDRTLMVVRFPRTRAALTA